MQGCGLWPWIFDGAEPYEPPELLTAGSARRRPFVAMLAPLCAAGVLVAVAVAMPGVISRPAPRSSYGANFSAGDMSRVVSENSPFVAGSGALTLVGTGSPGFSGDSGKASSADIDAPGGLADDRQGDLFIADTGDCRVREVPSHSGSQFSISMEAGHIYTVAGGACGSNSDHVGFVSSVAVDSDGDLFIADPTDDTVSELPASNGEHLGISMSKGKLTVVAGTGKAGATGEGQPAITAGLDDPQGIGLDAQGDLLIADTANCEVREVASRNGLQWGIPMHIGDIYRIAGTGVCGQVGDGGSSTTAELWDPVAVATGPAGDVVVSNAGAEEVLDLASRTGDYYGVPIRVDHLAVVAGVGSYGPYLVDGLPATGQIAGLDSPSDVAVTPSGDLLISDTYSDCIREVPTRSESELGVKITPGNMYTLAGAVPTGPGGASTNWVGTQMLYPVGIAVAPDGSVLFSDQGANVVRELTVSG